MNRREAIQQVAWLMGGAISAPAILGVLGGCSPKASVTWKPVFLTEAQGAMVADVAELMIPRTDTPGAGDVGVPAFIDLMLKDAYPKRDQERFLSGLAALGEDAKRAHGRGFIELPAQQRMALLQKIHDAAAAEERQLNLPPAQLQRPFVLMMKELSMLGYFTSKVGATQVLQYVAVPGGFRACIPVAQAGNGKTWAVETSTRF
jgi:glucoside 3-dehydrogenase (cytochrome c) hitch-hiker subunit